MLAYNLPVHLNYPDMPTVAECQLLTAQGKCEEAIGQCRSRLAILQNNSLTLFLPETYQLLAEAYRQADRKEEAINVLEDGLKLSRSMGTVWRKWQLLGTKASLVPRIQASLLRAEAGEYIDFILDHIEDPTQRQSFLEMVTVVTIKGEPEEQYGPKA